MDIRLRLKTYLAAFARTALGAALVLCAFYNLLRGELAISAADKGDFVEPEKFPPISLNTASVRELQKINGVGEKTAESIVAYREENGEFTSAEELLEINGIGEATLEKILPQIVIE